VGEVDRPNLMIKIPGIPAGVPAIAATIDKGINVNVTLLFSIEAYKPVALAFVEGLEKRAASVEAVDKIAGAPASSSAASKPSRRSRAQEE
jgi:transaldolase